jgi:SAM-dependent methyltransferase
VTRCSNYVEHYRADAEHFDYFVNRDPADSAYERLFHKFVQILSGRPRNIVDIGSGGGWTATIPHENIFFVDLSKTNLAALKSERSGPVFADAHRLPFKNDSLDFVIASEIIEHLNDPAAAASEIWRVLKPGGRAVVSTPYKERIKYTLCVHCNKPTPWNAHLHSFDRAALLSLFPSQAKRRSYLFGSKILSIMRMPIVFRNLPLPVWRAFDSVLTRLVDKAQHVIVVIEKTPEVPE